MVLKVSLKSATAGGIPSLHGENSHQSYYRASEIRKNASRSLIKKLRKVELEGGCVDVLSECNVCVYPSGKCSESSAILVIPIQVSLLVVHDAST